MATIRFRMINVTNSNQVMATVDGEIDGPTLTKIATLWETPAAESALRFGVRAIRRETARRAKEAAIAAQQQATYNAAQEVATIEAAEESALDTGWPE